MRPLGLLLLGWLSWQEAAAVTQTLEIGEAHASGEHTIDIGVALTLSEYSTTDRAMARALELFIQDFNNVRGGLHINNTRRALTVRIVDDHGTQEGLNTAMDILINGSTQLFIGRDGVGMMMAAAEKVHSNNLTMVSPCCVNPTIFEGKPQVFGLETSVLQVFPEAFDLVASQVGPPQTVAFFSAPGERYRAICGTVPALAQNHSMTWLDNFTMSITKQQEVIAVVDSLESLQPQPELVVGCIAGDICNWFLEEVANRNLNPKAIILTQCIQGDVFARLGDKARYVLGVNAWDDDAEQRDGDWSARRFRAAYMDLHHGEPPPDVAFRAFSSLDTMAAAIEMANSTDPVLVAEQLRSNVFGTIYGNINFTNGQNTRKWTLEQIGAGQTTEVTLGDTNASFHYPTPVWADRECYNNDVPGSRVGFDGNGICSNCSNVAAWLPGPRRRSCEVCANDTRLFISVGNTDIRYCQPDCPRGFGGATCEPCPAGTFEESDTCQPCDLGRFSDQANSTACEKCPAGSKQDVTGSSTCDLCIPGRSSSVEGSQQCVTCPKGKSTDTYGTQDCVLCSAGYVASSEGMSSCTACDPGHQSEWGAGACMRCPQKTYQPNAGSDTCIPDGPGQWSDDLGTVLPENEAGYWSRPGGGVEACGFDPQACERDRKCTEGYAGRQCTSCIPGYSRGKTGCFKCSPRLINILVTCTVSTTAVVVGLLLCRFIIYSVGRPQDTILVVLFKQLVNHCVTMSVCHTVLISILREAPLSISRRYIWWAEFLANPLNMFDGMINTETFLWSIACLMQPAVSEDVITELQQSNHTSYWSKELQPALEVLRSVHTQTVLALVLFYFFWPFFYMAAQNAIGLVALSANVSRHRDLYTDAFVFYKEVKEQGFKNVEKKYMERKRRQYIDAYYHRINGIWSPASHVLRTQASRSSKTQRNSMISIDLFQEESVVIKTFGFFWCYAPLCRAVARPFLCVKLGDTYPDAEYFVFSFASLSCSGGEPILWLAAGMSFIWFVCFPAFMYYRLWKVHDQLHLPKKMHEFGFTTCGYRWDFWWWDPVVFIRKALCFVIEVMPFISERERIMFFLVLSIFFFVLEFTFSPYDDRCNGLFHRLELQQLAMFITYMMFMQLLHEMITQTHRQGLLGDSVGIAMTACCAFLSIFHCLYVVYVTYNFLEYFLDMAVNQMDTAMTGRMATTSKNRLLRRIQQQLIDMQKARTRESPYVSYDSLYGWITICGSHGDVAVPPYMPKGEMAREYKDNRPLLSQAPLTPEGVGGERVAVANCWHRMELQRILTMAVNHITASHESGPAFSLSVFDFVIRAAFVLCKGDKMLADPNESSRPAEIDRNILKEAVVKGDPLLFKVGQAEPTMEHAGEEEKDYLTRALLMEEELQIHFSEARHARDEREAAEGMARSLCFCRRRDCGACWESRKRLRFCCRRAPARGSTAEEVKMEREEHEKSLNLKRERFGLLVHGMFSPGIFRRGLTLLKLQFGLMQLQSLPREDLVIWLDLFERQWLIERAKANNTLESLAGLRADKSEESALSSTRHRRGTTHDTLASAVWEEVVSCDQAVQTSVWGAKSISSVRLSTAHQPPRYHSEGGFEKEERDPSMEVALRWLGLVVGAQATVSITSLRSAMRPSDQRRAHLQKALKEIQEQQELEEARIKELQDLQDKKGLPAVSSPSAARGSASSGKLAELPSPKADEAPQLGEKDASRDDMAYV